MKRILSILVIIGLGWLLGFFAFVTALPAPASGMPTRAEGVVIFTGDASRLSSGMALFEAGAGQRLLISGVNPELSRDEISAFWPGSLERFDCCVDLGLQAQTTTGNADELKGWATTHNFSSIVLVTSEYHMPRALAQTRKRLKGVTIIPYPIASTHLDADGRPQSLSSWRKLAGEYSKYITVRAINLMPDQMRQALQLS